jgi:hypothetical protein
MRKTFTPSLNNSQPTCLLTFLLTTSLIIHLYKPISNDSNPILIYEIPINEQELFAVYKVSIDLRHVSNYNGAFSYEQQWEINLTYRILNGKEINIVFDNSFYPEPTGYFSSSNVPFR